MQKSHFKIEPDKGRNRTHKTVFFSAKISEKMKKKKISVVPPASNMEPVAALRHTINCLEELQCHSVLPLYHIQHCIRIIYILHCHKQHSAVLPINSVSFSTSLCHTVDTVEAGKRTTIKLAEETVIGPKALLPPVILPPHVCPVIYTL